MQDALGVVTEFIKAMDADTAGIAAAFRRWFTPSTIWDNVGLAKTTGVEEAITLIDGFGENLGVAAMRFELLAIAATGGKVLTERIDHMFDASGNVLASLPLMGIFEIDADGKISRWSDYFDTAGFQAGWGATARQ